MIRINLLPFRLARKKENIRRQVSIFLLLIAFTIVALFWWTITVNKQILEVQGKTKQVNQQIATYKEKADRVNKIKNDLKILKEKLTVVASLKKQRDQQLVLFDSMTGLVVPERMWLNSFSTNANVVTIKGVAFDNPTIAEFMKRLEDSPLFDKIDLKKAEIKKFKNNVMLKSFELQCRKETLPQEKKEVNKQGKK